MILRRCFLGVLVIFTICVAPVVKTVYAAPVAPKTLPSIVVNSFLGTYSFNRQNNGLSLLTTTEVISVNFPNQGTYYGINRELPEVFNGHSVNLKILGVSDEAGNPISYKVSSENGNQVIVTGDPSIILFGDQTYTIRYQTSDVINLSAKTDEFLLNVNGRGWNQPVNNVQATIILPSDLSSKLQTNPICYDSIVDSSGVSCQILSQKSSQGLKIIARSTYLPAHQSLLVRLNFQPNTFNHPSHHSWFLVAVAFLIIIGGGYLFQRLARKIISKYHKSNL